MLEPVLRPLLEALFAVVKDVQQKSVQEVRADTLNLSAFAVTLLYSRSSRLLFFIALALSFLVIS